MCINVFHVGVHIQKVLGWRGIVATDADRIHVFRVGRGIGTMLLERAKTELGSPIWLYTFQASVGARRFYERHGFRVIAVGDGSDNEEQCPDVLYEWRG